jgi:hypothetical protein
MNETVATTYFSYTSHSYIHICILKFRVFILFFFSYLDIFSLDNDSFDYRNVD